MAMASSDLDIDRISAAVGRYYKSLGRPYNNEFAIFCAEIGMQDVDALNEELEEDPEDCALIEFDDNFPFKKEPKYDEERSQLIFELVKKIIEHPDITFASEEVDLPTFNRSFFTVAPKDEDKAKERLKIELSTLYDAGMENDQGFIRWMAVEYQSGFPYLSYLRDAYQRAVVNDVASSVSYWKIAHWEDLGRLDVGSFEKILPWTYSGVNSYLKRVSPHFFTPQITKICDSLEDVSRFVCNICTVVKDLEVNGALQLDVSFIVSTSDDDMSDDEDDEDDEDEPDEDDDKQNDETMMRTMRMKQWQPIKSRGIKSILDEHKVTYHPLKAAQVIESLASTLQ
eukprot:286925_1